MASDVVVAQELKSLQQELAASQTERRAASSSSPSTTSAEIPLVETPEQRELRDQLSELANEAKEFFENAQKSVSAHPTESVVGALLIGIMIGRLTAK